MEPLLGDMPLIGALSVFFLKKPVRQPPHIHTHTLGAYVEEHSFIVSLCLNTVHTRH